MVQDSAGLLCFGNYRINQIVGERRSLSVSEFFLPFVFYKYFSAKEFVFTHLLVIGNGISFLSDFSIFVFIFKRPAGTLEACIDPGTYLYCFQNPAFLFSQG